MSVVNQAIQSQFLEEIKKNAGLTIWIGVVILLLGIFAMASPLVAGKSVAMIVGILLIIGGLGQLLFAFKTDMGVLAVILGGLTVALGGYMLANLGTALAAMTIFLTLYLIVSGILDSIFAFQIKPANGWGMVLFSGLLSVLLGILIWSQFPLSGAWAIGILLGIRLFFTGSVLVMFGLAARGAVKELASTS
jgi:uncharacterized membrane protein HdeD (DUF308 family)